MNSSTPLLESLPGQPESLPAAVLPSDACEREDWSCTPVAAVALSLPPWSSTQRMNRTAITDVWKVNPSNWVKMPSAWLMMFLHKLIK